VNKLFKVSVCSSSIKLRSKKGLKKVVETLVHLMFKKLAQNVCMGSVQSETVVVEF